MQHNQPLQGVREFDFPQAPTVSLWVSLGRNLLFPPFPHPIRAILLLYVISFSLLSF